MKMADSSDKSKATLKRIYETAVHLQEYEAAGYIKNMGCELFPVTEEESAAKYRSGNLRTALEMVGIRVDEKIVFAVDATIKSYDQLGEDFDLRIAAKIKADADEFFGTRN